MSEESSPERRGSLKTLSVWRAILVGWSVINIPALIIILSVLLIGFKIVPGFWWLFLIVGVIAGWTWWSFTVPRWRRWAHRKGVNPEKLQKAAVASGLVWPKGSFFEKTEFKIKDSY